MDRGVTQVPATVATWIVIVAATAVAALELEGDCEFSNAATAVAATITIQVATVSGPRWSPTLFPHPVADRQPDTRKSLRPNPSVATGG